MAADITFTVSASDGSSDELVIPAGLLDRLTEGSSPAAEALGDIATLALAQQIHGFVHHTHGEVDEELLELEETMLERFEDRFGESFESMTGHAH